jgi:hypothetical protein
MPMTTYGELFDTEKIEQGDVITIDGSTPDAGRFVEAVNSLGFYVGYIRKNNELFRVFRRLQNEGS